MFISVSWWFPGLPVLAGGPPCLPLLGGGPQVYLC